MSSCTNPGRAGGIPLALVATPEAEGLFHVSAATGLPASWERHLVHLSHQHFRPDRVFSFWESNCSRPPTWTSINFRFGHHDVYSCPNVETLKYLYGTDTSLPVYFVVHRKDTPFREYDLNTETFIKDAEKLDEICNGGAYGRGQRLYLWGEGITKEVVLT